MEIPFISSFMLLQPNATHRCTMFSPFAKKNTPVLTSQTTIPKLPPCAVLYRTGSEISRICRPQMRGRKIDREFIFLIFIREKHEDSIKQIKKSVIYTLSIVGSNWIPLHCNTNQNFSLCLMITENTNWIFLTNVGGLLLNTRPLRPLVHCNYVCALYVSSLQSQPQRFRQFLLFATCKGFFIMSRSVFLCYELSIQCK